MTSTTNAVDHGISITQVQAPAGRPLIAACLCGWSSALVGSRPQAVAAGEAHLEQLSNALDSSPTRDDNVRDRLRQGVTNPQTLAWIDELCARDERVAASSPTVIPPCPSWCRSREIFTKGLHSDHGYDSVSHDERTFSRYHVSGQGDFYLAQEEECTVDGVVTLGPVHLTIPENDGCEGLTAAQARQFAADLLVGADELDKITGAAVVR